MKWLFGLLLAANLVLGAWLLLGDPVDIMREPARMALQIEPARFHVLTEADAARLRIQADAASAADDAAKAAARPEAAKPGAAAADAPRTAAAPADGAPADSAGLASALPSAGCVELGDFASESAAKKARARLAEIGPEEHLSISTTEHATRVRMTGVDAALEIKIQRVLKDFPRQHLTHCADKPATG
jgi:hypothetical protein